MKKMFNEGNQIHNFMSSSGSGTVINYGSGSDFFTRYGSGSTSQKVTVPSVPVVFRFHNTGYEYGSGRSETFSMIRIRIRIQKKSLGSGQLRIRNEIRKTDKTLNIKI